eukprot:Gb_39706 [translate_table: standard]
MPKMGCMKFVQAVGNKIELGGLNRENDQEFYGAEGGVLELIIKAGAKHTLSSLSRPFELAASKDDSFAPVAPVVEAIKADTELVKTIETNGTTAEQSSPIVEPQHKERNYVFDLKESERKALQELKIHVEEAILNNEFNELGHGKI